MIPINLRQTKEINNYIKKNKIKRIIYKYNNSKKYEYIKSNISKYYIYNSYIENIYNKTNEINNREIFNKTFFIKNAKKC